MDLSTLDILLGLAAIALITVAGIAVHHRRRPAPIATTPPPPASSSSSEPSGSAVSPGSPGSSSPSPSETGRHHVPNGLLDSPTTRLRPDILARARRQHLP